MGTLSKLRRMVLRENVSVREAARRLRISRNTARRWLAEPEMVQPVYPKRVAAERVIDAYKEQLKLWMKADRQRNKRERRTVKAYFEALRAMGYSGGMTQVYIYCRKFKAAGWEKGIVEKNVQDRRKNIWREVSERRWASLEELNIWLTQACQSSWGKLAHPQWPELTVADVWQDERAHLMPCPKPFDGYVELPARVSATALIHYQRNRYSVPCEWVNSVVSLRAYPEFVRVVSVHGEVVDLVRSFERDQTFYDWQHYITLIERKPGALRNGAPFKTMPEPLQELQHQLLKHPGGDRVMAQVLSAVPLHGLDAVLGAIELALQVGRISAEHVLNTLAHLKEQAQAVTLEPVHTPLALQTPPQANVLRYDSLRHDNLSAIDQEVCHVQ